MKKMRVFSVLSGHRFREGVDYKTQTKEKVRYSMTSRKVYSDVTVYDAEVIDPHSPMFGYRASGYDPITATKRLSDKLASTFGFIGQLVEFGREAYNEGLLSDFTRGRGPHTDLVDQDPLSDAEDADLWDERGPYAGL